MDINSQSKLFDVLTAYPQLEEQIINIAPPFKNLQNPILRKTVGKIATLAQVAQVGGVDESRLVNTLRKAAGLSELQSTPVEKVAVEITRSQDDPDWISGEPQFIVDGSDLLEHGEVPLAKVNTLIAQLYPDRYLLLVTNFEPTPILELMEKRSLKVFHKVAGNTQTHLTFIQ